MVDKKTGSKQGARVKAPKLSARGPKAGQVANKAGGAAEKVKPQATAPKAVGKPSTKKLVSKRDTPVKLPKLSERGAKTGQVAEKADPVADHLIPSAAAPKTVDEVLAMQAPLIERLNAKMKDDNLNQGQFADKLGFTASYVTSIFNGFRWVPKSDREVIRELATYLGVPVLQIFIWTGFFSVFDMVSQDNLANRLETLHKVMFDDPQVRHIVPPRQEWAILSLETRLRFVLMYEIVSRRALLAHAEMEVADTMLKTVKYVLAESA